MVEWPSRFEINSEGFRDVPAYPVQDTETLSGVPKSRRLYGRGFGKIFCTIFLKNLDEYQAFETLFVETLIYGSVPVKITNPTKNRKEKWRFSGPPSITPLGRGGIAFKAACEFKNLGVA